MKVEVVVVEEERRRRKAEHSSFSLSLIIFQFMKSFDSLSFSDGDDGCGEIISYYEIKDRRCPSHSSRYCSSKRLSNLSLFRDLINRLFIIMNKGPNYKFKMIYLEGESLKWIDLGEANISDEGPYAFHIQLWRKPKLRFCFCFHSNTRSNVWFAQNVSGPSDSTSTFDFGGDPCHLRWNHKESSESSIASTSDPITRMVLLPIWILLSPILQLKILHSCDETKIQFYLFVKLWSIKKRN